MSVKAFIPWDLRERLAEQIKAMDRLIERQRSTRPEPQASHAQSTGKDMEPNREFLFTYRFDGAEWGITVFARDPAEAREKIKAVALARYDGELHVRIPAGASLFGLVPRLIVWLRQRQPKGDRDTS